MTGVRNDLKAPGVDGHDEFTLRTSWDRLIAVANTSATSMYRTSFSPTVQMIVDIGFGIVDAAGQLLVVSDIGSTGHMVPIEAVCSSVLDAIKDTDVEEGDVYILNDPWITSGHLLDVAVVTPIVRDGKVIGAVGSIFHASDVGGLGVSSMGADVYEEGLFLPVTRIARGGAFDDRVMGIVLANIRRPEYFVGDLQAAITGNRSGVDGILELLEELGLDDLQWISSEVLSRSEKAMRAALANLQDGTYHASSRFDPVFAGAEPLLVNVEVTVAGDEVTVDFAGSAPQVPRGLNSTLIYTTAYTQYAVRLAVTDRIPWNAGSMAPVKVLAPSGSVVACEFPSPTALRHAIGQNVPQLVLRALSEAGPPHMAADSCGSNVIINFIPQGHVVRDGRVNVASGQGARSNKRGLNATTFPARGRMQQLEVSEQDGYFRYRSRALRRGSGGHGRFNGGDGMVVEVEFVASPGVLDVNQERTMFPPDGLFGGEPGAPSVAFINGQRIDSRFRGRVEVGDVLRVESAGGGGFGTPSS